MCVFVCVCLCVYVCVYVCVCHVFCVCCLRGEVLVLFAWSTVGHVMNTCRWLPLTPISDIAAPVIASSSALLILTCLSCVQITIGDIIRMFCSVAKSDKLVHSAVGQASIIRELVMVSGACGNVCVCV